MRSRLARYLLTLILPSGLLCLIFVSSLHHEDQVRVRESLEAAEELRLVAGARSLIGDIEMIAGDTRPRPRPSPQTRRPRLDAGW